MRRILWVILEWDFLLQERLCQCRRAANLCVATNTALFCKPLD